MQAALARVGRNGLTTEELVEPSSLTFQDVTPVRPKLPELAQPSDADLQADATGMEQILKELHRTMQEMRAEVTAEMRQVCAEVQVWRAEMEKWRAEMEKTVRTVELKEAQLRTQILGTAEGLVSINQPFIVLTETKFSYRYIPVWARYSPHRTRVEAHANMLSP
jgi:HSP90 family molecular chaperone